MIRIADCPQLTHYAFNLVMLILSTALLMFFLWLVTSVTEELDARRDCRDRSVIHNAEKYHYTRTGVCYLQFDGYWEQSE